MDINYSNPKSQGVIIQLCAQACENRVNVISPSNAINLVVRLTNTLAVKFGIGVTAAEADALKFASQRLDPAVVKVPSVIQFFTRPSDELWTTGYLVMDFIEGTTLDQLPLDDYLQLTDRITQVIQHIHSFRSSRPGPLDGSPSRGLLWSEYDSGQSFNSRKDLQKYLDTRLAHLQGEVTIDVSDMALSLCHLDIAPRNIIVSTDRSIYLLDWGCAGFYPPVFETWAIQLEAFVRGHPFMKALGSELISRSSFPEVAQVEALMHVYRANQSIAL